MSNDSMCRYETKDEAVNSDAKNSDYVSINLDDGSYVVYKPNFHVQETTVGTSYHIGTLGDLRTEKSPLVLVSAMRGLVFSFDATTETYRIFPDRSVPENASIDTSFFPAAAIDSVSNGRWLMTMSTSRFEVVDSPKKISKGSKFLLLGNDLYSPSAQKMNGMVQSFRVDSNHKPVLIVSMLARKAGTHFPMLSSEDMKRVDAAADRVSQMGMGEPPSVTNEDEGFFQ